MPTSTLSNRIQVIDSHTAGEPTRCVIAGGPELGRGSMADRLDLLRREHDEFRRAVLLEPRGSDVLVGALLLTPLTQHASAGVIFFNNAGYLGMCGHGTIGVITTLAFMGNIKPGTHMIETPVGTVSATLHDSGEVSIANVPAWRFRKGVPIDIPGHGQIHGDVAWGGNWFFLVDDHGKELSLGQADDLTDFSLSIREALIRNQITGPRGEEIDHIELSSAPQNNANDSRNFVLCPGGAYDRSPCGTGTSAKVACLAADGKLAPGEVWRQEGILGSVFTGTYESQGDSIIPHITGSAFITAQATLIFDPNDPFRIGIDSKSLAI